MVVSSTKVIRTYRGDTAPNLTFNVTRSDGSIVNLTGATVTFIIQDPVTHESTNDINTNLGITNKCPITDPVNGVCVYAWNHGGTDTPDVGFYPANLKIEHADGTVETYAMKIAVEYSLIS